MTAGVSSRLREERQKTGKNQQAFAALAGASRNSQVEYETGRTAPNTGYLLALANHGVDAGYILTGRRAFESLNEQLSSLIVSFERLSPAWQTTIAALVAQAAGSAAQPEGAAPDSEAITLPREDALAEMFEGLLMTIDRDADLAEQGLLLAQRLPIGLSQVRDLLPAEDHTVAPVPTPATGEDRAMRRRVPTR